MQFQVVERRGYGVDIFKKIYSNMGVFGAVPVMQREKSNVVLSDVNPGYWLSMEISSIIIGNGTETVRRGRGCIVIRVRPTLKHKNIMVLAWRLGMERSSILKSGDWSSQTIMPARRRRRRTIWCFEHRDNEWIECIFLGSIFFSICPCDHHLNGSWHNAITVKRNFWYILGEFC